MCLWIFRHSSSERGSYFEEFAAAIAADMEVELAGGRCWDAAAKFELGAGEAVLLLDTDSGLAVSSMTISPEPGESGRSLS